MFSHIKELFTRPSGYRISRSVRFRSSASAYFNRTPASNGNRQIFTHSVWVKRGTMGAVNSPLLTSYSSATDYAVVCLAANSFLGGSTQDTFSFTVAVANVLQLQLISSALYRDPSAWYHFVLSVDTTQSTASNRIKMYVNGVQITSFTTATYPAQNANIGYLNTTNAQQIGALASGTYGYFDGYMTEINFIDGQQLTPSSFGQINSQTGVWQPIKYAGTYGTNGFYLNFSDNSNNTATTIGKDYSGNGNNWTPNNISVTAGATYDSMLDVPTLYADGGNGRGNYAVLNPIDTNSSSTLSDANLKQTCTLGPSRSVATMRLPNSGKYYAEFINSSAWNSNTGEGFGVSAESVANNGNSAAANSYHFYASASAYVVNNGTYTGISSITNSANQTFQLAADVDNGKVWIGQNNTWYDSAGGTTGNPSTGANATFTIACAGFKIFTYIDSTTSINWQANFGQRPFTYTPPTGFVALNTQNLPTPTISNGATVMAATTYTGNGATGQSIANTLNGVSFQPDLVWAKSRSGAYDNGLQDSVRGVTKDLNSNNTDAEETRASSITAFTSSGFTLGGNDLIYNGSGSTYVAWQWNAGGSTVTNTSGSISSQVRANATAGFSVVTYTGTGANATVGHGLGVAPKMVIVKLRSGAGENWNVWHTSLASTTYRMLLNTTGAVDTTSPTIWSSGGINPTSTTFTVGTATGTNGSSSTYVAYCFAAVAGYSAFGSYTGNGSADGPFVYLGFRPRYLLIKSAVVAGGTWVVFDSARSTYNVTGEKLAPNTADLENSGATGIAGGVDFLSNGFKIRLSWGDINTSNTLIYAAFAENPFKLSLAR